MTRLAGTLTICASLLIVGYILGCFMGLPDLGGSGHESGPSTPAAPVPSAHPSTGSAPMGTGVSAVGLNGTPTSRPATVPVSPAAPVVVAPVLRATIRERVSGTGVLTAVREVTVSARIEGVVETVDVEEGDTLLEGAPLCAIDEAALRIAERQARIEHEYAQAEHQRLTALHGESRAAVSGKELETAHLAVERAEIARARAALDLTYARPHAPFDGTIVKRHIHQGQAVRPGDALFTIADFDPLQVSLYLPEREVLRVSVGQPAELRAERGAGVLASGAVLRISPVVDRATLTVEVLVSFPRPPSSVRPGAFGRVDLITRTHPDTLLVPRSALLRATGAPPVLFRVTPDACAQRLAVETGYEDEAVVEITGAQLAPDDLVIVEGQRDLEDGARVQIHRETETRGNPLSVLPKEP